MLNILGEITIPWCPVVNAEARHAVGTRCHLAQLDGLDVLDENTVTVFCRFFSAISQCTQLKLSQVTFVSSFLIIWPTNRHSVDKNHSMTLPLTKLCSVMNLGGKNAVNVQEGC